MHFITWDVGILAALALLVAYTIIIRKHKSLATLVSVYIAYVMTSVWGDRVTGFFAGDRVLFNQVWIKANASPFIVQTALLIVITFLLSTFLKLGGRRSRYSLIEVVVYAVSTLAVTIYFMLTFASPELRTQILAHSKIIPYIYAWREWVLVIPIFLMILFGIYGNDD